MRTSAPARTVFVYEFVTGGGLADSDLPSSWTVEGSAMRRAIVEDFAIVPGLRVVTTRDYRLPAEPGPWSTLSVGPDEDLETFRRLAAEADYTLLVAPETGGVLRERARILEQAGCLSLGSSSAAIELTGNKWLLSARLQQHSIPTPASRLIEPGAALPANADYPAVLKPVDGAGAVNTFWISSPDALPDEARSMPQALLQPFVPGTPMSASFLVLDDARKVLIGMTHQHVDRDTERFVYRGGRVLPSTEPVPLDDLVGAIDAVPGLRGWVGVDFVLPPDGGRAVILEINPRLTTSYVGLRQLAPAGELARTWYEALAHPVEFDSRSWSRARIHSRSLSFLADGSVDGEVFAA